MPDPREPVEPFLPEPVPREEPLAPRSDLLLPVVADLLDPVLRDPLAEDFPVVAPRPAFLVFAMMSSQSGVWIRTGGKHKADESGPTWPSNSSATVGPPPPIDRT
jgi:hypothetical protein